MERQRQRRLLSGVAALLTAGVAGWVVGWSPLLRVSDVLVEGADRTPEAAVIKAAGLSREDHLLLLPSDAVAARVEALPWVRSAEVDRILPGRVRVTVVERRPALVLATGEGRWTLDATGRVLASGEAVSGLPILSAAAETGIRPGSVLGSEAARDAVRAWRALPGRVRREVRGIVAPTLERITFLLADTTQIRYGAAERLRAKNAVLIALLEQLEANGGRALYVDVRVPSNPAIRPAGADPEPTATESIVPDPEPTPSPSA